MRVLFFSAAPPPDQPKIREKYRAIAANGVSLVVATPGGTATTDGSIRFAPVPVKGSDPAQLRWHSTTIKRLLSEHRPELVHIEADPDSNLAATVSAIARRSGIPYALFSWQSFRPSLGLLAARRRRVVLRDAAGVIGGNRIAMSLLADGAPNAIGAVILPHGVTLPDDRPDPANAEFTMAFAGRLVPERGADFLIQALGQTFGKWRLLMAGTGPEQEAIEALVARLGLASRIRWLGGLRDEALATVWREADCLILPSRDTPTWVDYHSPLLLEAMGCGLAPVVTRAGCLPDLVGDAGVVVDTVERLTETLQRWVAAPAECRVVGAAARQRVLSRYVTETVAATTVAFWREVISTG